MCVLRNLNMIAKIMYVFQHRNGVVTLPFIVKRRFEYHT